jgi:hypothetical protein
MTWIALGAVGVEEGELQPAIRRTIATAVEGRRIGIRAT